MKMHALNQFDCMQAMILGTMIKF